MLRIDVYSIMRNEARMLPYFLRHYETFARRIFIYDDESDDGSQELLKHPKVEVRDAPVGIDDYSFRTLYETEYQKFSPDADWIICADADEFVYHPQILEVLSRCDAEVIACEGYTMIDKLPEGDGQIYDELKMGVPDVWMDKPVIFRPNIQMRFSKGRHSLHHKASFRVARDTGIKLLHYRFLGDEYVQARNKRNAERLTERNIRGRLGKHNLPGSHYYHSFFWYQQNKNKAVRVI